MVLGCLTFPFMLVHYDPSVREGRRALLLVAGTYRTALFRPPLFLFPPHLLSHLMIHPLFDSPISPTDLFHLYPGTTHPCPHPSFTHRTSLFPLDVFFIFLTIDDLGDHPSFLPFPFFLLSYSSSIHPPPLLLRC